MLTAQNPLVNTEHNETSHTVVYSEMSPQLLEILTERNEQQWKKVLLVDYQKEYAKVN